MRDRSLDIDHFYAGRQLPFLRSSIVTMLMAFCPFVLVYSTAMGAEKDGRKISLLNFVMFFVVVAATGWLCERVRFKVRDKVPCGLTFANWLGLRYTQNTWIPTLFSYGFLVSQTLFLVCQLALVLRELKAFKSDFPVYVFLGCVVVVAILGFRLGLRLLVGLAPLFLPIVLALFVLHWEGSGGLRAVFKDFWARDWFLYQGSFQDQCLWVGRSSLFLVGVMAVFFVSQQFWQVGFATKRGALDRAFVSGAVGSVVLALGAFGSGILVGKAQHVSSSRLLVLYKESLTDSLALDLDPGWILWLAALAVAGVLAVVAAQISLSTLVAFDFGWPSVDSRRDIGIGPAQGDESGEKWMELASSGALELPSRRGRLVGFASVILALFLAEAALYFHLLGFILSFFVAISVYFLIPTLLLVFSEDDTGRKVLGWGFGGSAAVVLLILVVIVLVVLKDGFSDKVLIWCAISFLIADAVVWAVSYYKFRG